MNKHLIILPLLITSAVSLHILSFQLEEPEEIVLNPEESVMSSPLGDESVQPSPEESILSSSEPTPSSQESVVSPQSVKPSKAPDVKPSSVQTKPSNKPEVKATPKPVQSTVPTPSVAPTAVPSPSVAVGSDTLKVASTKYIPIKGFNEIVKEAKVSSGRMDPFLSMEPPDIKSIPVFVAPPKNEVFNQTPKDKKIYGMPQHMKLKNPPTNWVPNFDSSNKSIKDKNKIYSLSSKISSKTGKPLTKVEIKQIEEERIDFEIKSMTNGIELTGIITGSKPVAIVKVGDESKVVGIGQVLKTDSEGRNIKITSIDINNQVISLSNGRRKAKIEVKEE